MNLLLTRLSKINLEETRKFVEVLIEYIDGTFEEKENAHSELKKRIPIPPVKAEKLEAKIFPFGLSVLLEFVFVLILF